MSLIDLLKKASLAISLSAALSSPAKADEVNLRVNPQKILLNEAIYYFEQNDVPRIRSRLRGSISLNNSYETERKARVQVILYNNNLTGLPQNPGCFDRETVRAIKKLQWRNRIRPVDGNVGQTTAGLISSLGEFSLEEGIILRQDVSCRHPNQQLVTEIQTNLMILNYLPDDIASGTLDDATILAIRDYKRRNTINNADTIDPSLIAHLSLSSNERLRILENALRQHSRLMGDSENHIYVNIPEFRFRYYYNGKVEFDMDLVVGSISNNGSLSRKWHTNVQRGFVNNVLINPWWNVPDGALTQEVREDMEEDLELRTRMQQLVDGRWIFDTREVDGRKFRHIPGPNNPLGRIAYDIHGGEGELIHDTPFRELFNRTIRQGSHGCMRSNRPLEFALKLKELGFLPIDNLNNYVNAIDESTGFYKTLQIALNRRILVNVVYSLAWADHTKNGLVVYFPNDIYRYNRTIVIPGADN